MYLCFYGLICFCVIQFEYIIFPSIHVTRYQSSYQAVAGGALYPFCAHSPAEPAGGAVSPPGGAGGGGSASHHSGHTSALLLAFSLELLNEIVQGIYQGMKSLLHTHAHHIIIEILRLYS